MLKETLQMLERRDVDLKELAIILYDIQLKYHENLTMDICERQILKVLEKREVQHAVMTGIAIDELAEKKLLPEPLQSIVERDEPLYGIDEILALSITNVYGSISFTNFGWLDKEKPGIIAKFNEKREGVVHTFLDDILCAIIAAGAGRLAHSNK